MERMKQIKPVQSQQNLEQQYNCNICKDEKYIYKTVNGNLIAKECSCFIKEKNLKKLEKSQVKERFIRDTFENYNIYSDETRKLRDRVKSFLNSKATCLFLGGNVGVGKTHLGMALLKEYENNGASISFETYDDLMASLGIKAQQNVLFEEELKRLLSVDILMIDELFNNNDLKNTHLNYLFKIINGRYNSNKTTIFTSNKSFDEFNDISEKMASRVFEMATPEFILDIKNIENFRYKLQK